jgi:ferrous iron transport protein B
MGNSLDARPVVVVGPQSSGTSTLAAALAGVRSRARNVAGSTVAVETFHASDRDYFDTPGIVHRLDDLATGLALDALDGDVVVLLTLRATHLDDELEVLPPGVAGRTGVVAVTRWDRVQDTETAHGTLAAVAGAMLLAAVVSWSGWPVALALRG